MDREIGQVNPKWNHLGDIHSWVKVRGPAIHIETLGPHEIWLVSENQISIFFCNKFEEEEPSSNCVIGDTIGDQRSTFFLDPVISSLRGGPQTCKLTHKGPIWQGDYDMHGVL